MAKIDPRRLSKKHREELEWTFLTALQRLGLAAKNRQLLRAMFTDSEVVMFARRIKVAEHLLRGLSYEEIEQNLQVGLSTIRFVHQWLGEDLERLRGLAASLQKDRGTKKGQSLKKSTYWEIDPYSFDGMRARYPQYFPLLNLLLGDPREKYEHDE